MKEYLDVVDERGIPTGEIVERSIAHKEGVRHRTAHLWLVRKRDASIQILLQKRACTKSFPGCYDISSAGHIPAGIDYIPSALRELQEELGITVQPEELICCGNRTITADEVFFGRAFHDRQYSRIFILWKDIEEDAFQLQKEEVDSVLWMDFEACIDGVRQNTFPHCIVMEELMLIRNAIERGEKPCSSTTPV